MPLNKVIKEVQWLTKRNNGNRFFIQAMMQLSICLFEKVPMSMPKTKMNIRHWPLQLLKVFIHFEEIFECSCNEFEFLNLGDKKIVETLIYYGADIASSDIEKSNYQI